MGRARIVLHSVECNGRGAVGIREQVRADDILSEASNRAVLEDRRIASHLAFGVEEWAPLVTTDRVKQIGIHEKRTSIVGRVGDYETNASGAQRRHTRSWRNSGASARDRTCP